MGTLCSSNCYLTEKKNYCFQHSISFSQIDSLIYPKKLITKVKLSQYTTLKDFLIDKELTSETIEYLALSYKHANELNNDDMAHIYKEVRQFKQLKLFKLNLSMKKISEKCIIILMKSLKKLQLLEFIDLNFYGIEKIQVHIFRNHYFFIQESGLTFICDCLANLTRLSYLSLNLGKINDCGIELISQTLLKLPLIQHLQLNLRENTQLSKYDHLFKAILSLKYLQHLGLLLMQRNFEENDFKKLLSYIIKLKQLKSFHFEHNGFDISLKNSKQFFSLGEFQQLIKLKIILVVLVYTEMDSVINIQKGITKLTNLEELELYFNFKLPGAIDNDNQNDSNSEIINDNSNYSESQCDQQPYHFEKLFKTLSQNEKLKKCKITINENDICEIDKRKSSDSFSD